MNMFSVFKKRTVQDFPGGPVVKTPHCQRRGHVFHSWSGKILHAVWYGQKKKKKRSTSKAYTAKLHIFVFVNIHAVCTVSFFHLFPTHTDLTLLNCAINIPLDGNGIVYFALPHPPGFQFGGFTKNL